MNDEREKARIRANVARMREQGASDEEVERYLTEHEGLKPVADPPARSRTRVPGVAAESTAAVPRPALSATKRSAPVKSAGVLRAVEQGLSFGFADEIAARIRSIGRDDTTYEQELERERAPLEELQKDHGGLATGVEIAASLPVAAGAGALARAKGLLTGRGSLLRRAAEIIGEGAAFGGITGAGKAEGGLGERATGAAVGATLGAATGAVVGGAGAGVRRVRDIAVDGTGTRAAVSRTAAGRLAGVASPEARATEKLVQGIERTGKSTRTVLEEARAAAATGKPVTLMELGAQRRGQGVQRVARGAQSVPSKGADQISDFLEERGESQLGRLTGDLEEVLGAKRENVFQTADDLVTQRADEASELYQQAFAHGAVDNPRIAEMLKLPWFQKAWAQAQRLAELDGKQLPQITRKVQRQEPIIFDGVPLKGPDGLPKTRLVEEIVVDEVPTVEALHYLKLGLDDVIDDGLRAPLERGGLNPTMAAKVLAKQNEFLQLLDADVPAYATARSAYAGRTRAMKAFEQGRTKFLGMDPREIERVRAGMSADEAELFRRGAYDAIANTLEGKRDGADLTRAVLGNEAIRARVRAIVDDATKFDEWTQRFGTERAMADTERFVLGGAQTARIQAEQADLAGIPDEAVLQLGTGNLLGAAKSMLTSLSNTARGFTPETVDAMAPTLTATGDDLVRRLESMNAGVGGAPPRHGVLRRAAEIMSGGAGGSAVQATEQLADAAPDPEVQRTAEALQRAAQLGVTVPPVRRRPAESSRAFRDRRRAHAATVITALRTAADSAEYQQAGAIAQQLVQDDPRYASRRPADVAREFRRDLLLQAVADATRGTPR